MIKEIFLPEKTATRRLIAKRIIGISIQEEVVSIAQIYAAPSTTLIEKTFEELIPPGAPNRYNERVSNIISKTLANCNKYDQIRLSIPSTVVTFKELILPFTDIEKINMVFEYEVEPQLPFSINDAIVDFIITDQDKEKQTSQILVAAVRKKDLQNIFDICLQANIDPNTITVDLFAMYGLYLQIPEYKNLPHASALVEIDASTTSIAFLLNGKVRLIRNISRGINTIAEHISEETSIAPTEIRKKLLESGLDKINDEHYNQAVQKFVTHFLNDIQFTINSFSLKLNFYKETSKILFVGSGAQIKGLMDFGSTLLQIPCELFSCNKLFKTRSFKNKTKKVINNWTNYVIALGSAIPYQPHDNFDLRKKEFAKKQSPLINKQLFTASALVIVIIFFIGVRGFLQTKNLHAIANQQEKQTILKLKKIFPPYSAARKKGQLGPLLKAAQQEVSIRQEMWAPFLQENLQPLQILQDLTQTIDRRLFNAAIEKIIISAGEEGSPIVELLGLFKSKPGEHFADYEGFKKFFEQHSSLLVFKEEPIVGFEEEGVKFTFKLKLKEKEQ